MAVDGDAVRRFAMLVLVFAAGASSPPRASALAGIGEHDRTYEYNRFAHLVAVSPGDICEGADKYCLRLVRPDGREFEGVGGTLEAISVPSQARSPYVLARRSLDDAWLVFDLGTDTILAESTDMQDALDVWEELGLTRPELIATHDAARYLDETRDSIVFRWGMQILFMAMGALIPSLLLVLIFGGLARRLKRGYRDTGSRVRLALARVCMVPATLAGIVLALCVAVLLTVWVMGLL